MAKKGNSNTCSDCGKIVETVSYNGKEVPVSWIKTLRLHRLAGPNTGGRVGVRTTSGVLCMVDGQDELVLHSRICCTRTSG
jgi:hypothetical protein